MAVAQPARFDLRSEEFGLPMGVEEPARRDLAERLLRDVVDRGLERVPLRDLRETRIVIVEELARKLLLRGLEGDGAEGHRQTGLERVVFRRSRGSLHET